MQKFVDTNYKNMYEVSQTISYIVSERYCYSVSTFVKHEFNLWHREKQTNNLSSALSSTRRSNHKEGYFTRKCHP